MPASDRPASPVEADWVLPGPFGTERWRIGAGHAAVAETAGLRIAPPLDPVTAERLRVRESRCAHPGPFPLAFRYCPDCGAALSDPPPVPVTESWSAPFGAADGLPEIHEARVPDPAGGEEIALPESPALTVAVAGTPPMLLACDAVRGRVLAWSERRRDWFPCAQVAPCLAPSGGSRTAGADADGLALATDHGAVWLDLRGPRPVAVTQVDRAGCLAGPIAMAGRMMVPVKGSDGVGIAVLDRDGPHWTTTPIPGSPPIGSGPLGPPFVAGAQAFWLGPQGILRAWHDLDGPGASWGEWPDNLSPLLQVRPVLERNGQPFQLARLDPLTLVLQNVLVPEDRRPAPGYVLGTGRAVFRENARLRLPWDERPLAEYPLPDDHFLLPLLGLGDGRFLLAVCAGRDGLGGFIGDPQVPWDGSERLCALHYSRGPRSLEPLGCVLRVRQAWELSAFVHANWLYVHGATENRCHRWPLRDA